MLLNLGYKVGRAGKALSWSMEAGIRPTMLPWVNSILLGHLVLSLIVAEESTILRRPFQRDYHPTHRP
jgi:hypothetical protein